MKLVSVSQMLSIEKEADASGLTYQHMMENAGRGLAEVVLDLEEDASNRTVVGLVGPGNNGGDALVALSQLASTGWDARAYLVKRAEDALVERFRAAGGRIESQIADDGFEHLSGWIADSAVLLDGLLGTGAKPPVRGEMADTITLVNGLFGTSKHPPLVLAVDCPSGIDCDTGEVPEECIAADTTVTMAAVKQGLLRLPAYAYVGDLRVVDIGLPAKLVALQSVRTEVVAQDFVERVLPARPLDAHKGTFGTALVVAGSLNYTGAAYLAAAAAYRVGTGLVTAAIPTPLHAALAALLPEATWLLLPHEIGVIGRDAVEVLTRGLPASTALLVGPGLGTERTTAEFVQRLITAAGNASGAAARMGFVSASPSFSDSSKDESGLPPAVFDADGLRLLAEIPDWHRLLPDSAVLTPHPGEMAVLTGLTKEKIQEDRMGVAARFAAEWDHVVVLKGAFTVIAAPDGRLSVVPVASPALSRAGTGDVLSGIIVGLRAQGVDSYEAAAAGAWIHAQAGLQAANRIGSSASILAGDVLDSIAEVMSAFA